MISSNVLLTLIAFMVYTGALFANSFLVYFLFKYLIALPKWLNNFTKIYNELNSRKSQNSISKPILLKYKLNYLLIIFLIISYLIFSFSPFIYVPFRDDYISLIIGLVSNIFIYYLQIFILKLITKYIENYINKNYEESIIEYMKSIESQIKGFSTLPKSLDINSSMDEAALNEFYKEFNINQYYEIKKPKQNQIKLLETIKHKINI